MLYRRFLECLIVTAACIASGTLECGHTPLSASQEHGKDLYVRMCAVCHGRGGEGYSADQAPALAHADFLASVSDDFLRNAIAYGRNGTTMSAWSTVRSGPLQPAEVEAVVSFLRSWEQKPREVLDEHPVGGDVARGQATYEAECSKCHGWHGMGGPNVHIGNPQLLADATNGFLRRAILRGRPGTAMPSFQAKLGPNGAEDAVAVLRSWQAPNKTLPQAPPPPAPAPPLPLGPVPLNPHGPGPVGFHVYSPPGGTTPADVIKAQLDRKARMALLDARAPSDYINEHIAGAVSVPFYDPDPYFAQLPKDAWLVCYCACPHAESGTLAQKLLAKGFTKVTVLDEGLGFWRNKGYGTHQGTEP